jgi:hypothetical protein
VFSRSLRKGRSNKASAADLDRAVRVGSTLLAHAATAEKNSPKMMDLTGFTEDETAELVMAMISDNAWLRKRIVGEPQMRKLLLADLDVVVLEHHGTLPTGVTKEADNEWQ